MTSDLALLTRHAVQAVRETAAFIHAEVGQVDPKRIEEKFLNGLVSYVDRTAEEMLVERLGRLLPEAVYLTEEDTVETQTGAVQWIIDPLDGTTNFLHAVPHFSVSVGLRLHDELAIGIVHHVSADECYYAWQGGGAWCEDERIHAAQRSELRQSLICTGFPYHNFSRADAWFKALRLLMEQGRGMRRFGSAALDLAYVACGRFDVFFEYGLNAWDVAGGALLVKEAGGRVTDFEGGSNYVDGGEILAANPAVFEAALAVMQDCFGHPANLPDQQIDPDFFAPTR